MEGKISGKGKRKENKQNRQKCTWEGKWEEDIHRSRAVEMGKYLYNMEEGRGEGEGWGKKRRPRGGLEGSARPNPLVLTPGAGTLVKCAPEMTGGKKTAIAISRLRHVSCRHGVVDTRVVCGVWCVVVGRHVWCVVCGVWW